MGQYGQLIMGVSVPCVCGARVADPDNVMCCNIRLVRQSCVLSCWTEVLALVGSQRYLQFCVLTAICAVV